MFNFPYYYYTYLCYQCCYNIYIVNRYYVMNIELLLCSGKFQVPLLSYVSIIILSFSYQIQIFLSEGILESKDFFSHGQRFYHIETSKFFLYCKQIDWFLCDGRIDIVGLMRATCVVTTTSVCVIFVQGCYCMSENETTRQETLSIYLKDLSKHVK